MTSAIAAVAEVTGRTNVAHPARALRLHPEDAPDIDRQLQQVRASPLPTAPTAALGPTVVQ
jgi:hypothetical protein